MQVSTDNTLRNTKKKLYLLTLESIISDKTINAAKCFQLSFYSMAPPSRPDSNWERESLGQVNITVILFNTVLWKQQTFNHVCLPKTSPGPNISEDQSKTSPLEAKHCKENNVCFGSGLRAHWRLSPLAFAFLSHNPSVTQNSASFTSESTTHEFFK